MSRSQDILGIIRGIQLVAGASVKTQEAYLKHLWSHSSVREIIEKNAQQTSEIGKKVVSNPSQELQNVGNILKETLERSSVVVEGIRQYSQSGRSNSTFGDMLSSSDSKSNSTINSLKNLDIASITLKELENLLAEHNKLREVNLRIDDPSIPKPRKAAPEPEPKVKTKAKVNFNPEVKVELKPKVMPIQVSPTPLAKVPIEQPASLADDEKQVESVLKFITNFDREQENSQQLTASNAVPEVSNLNLY